MESSTNGRKGGAGSKSPLGTDSSCTKKRVTNESHNNENPINSNNNHMQDEPDNNKDNNTSAKKKKKKGNNVTPKRQTDPLVLETRRTIQKCCARNDLATALRAYETAVANHVNIEAASFYNLLALCDGLEPRSTKVHVGTPKHPPSSADSARKKKPTPNETKKREELARTENDNVQSDNQKKVEESKDETPIETVSVEDRKRHAFCIKEHMAERQLPLNETAYTALVKILTKSGDLAAAEQVLVDAENDPGHVKVKLRLYSTLLSAYCGVREEAETECDNKKSQTNTTVVIMAALQLWLRLTQKELTLTEKEYMALIQGCIASSLLPETRAAVVERVLSDLAQDVLVPSRACSQAIVDWFECDAAATSPTAKMSSSSNELDTVKELLQRIRTQQQENQPAVPMEIPSMGPVQNGTGWTITRTAEIDAATAKLKDGCLEGESLRPVDIGQDTWKFMMQANETIVQTGGLDQHKSEFQGGRKGKKRRVDDNSSQKRETTWQHFLKFLNSHKDVNVIVDGANVGYFEQNFQGAPKHLDYHQLDWMIQHLLLEQKKVLVFLHHRHLQNAPPKYNSLIQNWKDSGVLYTTPFGMNDDWFWLQAALHYRALVVTNDEMRDHHFQMLAPRSFLSWKDRHQVHFSFGHWQQSGPKKHQKHRRVLLQFPDVYSRRIQRVAGQQGLVIPLPKCGDQNRFLDGKHVEEGDEAPREERYVCIRAKQLS